MGFNSVFKGLKSWLSLFRDHPVSKSSMHFHTRNNGNCVIWILWLVLCYVNNFPGIEQTLYKMHVGILCICKYWGISSNTATKHYATTPPRIIVGFKIESYSRTHPLIVAYRHASMRLHPDYNLLNLKWCRLDK